MIELYPSESTLVETRDYWPDALIAFDLSLHLIAIGTKESDASPEQAMNCLSTLVDDQRRLSMDIFIKQTKASPSQLSNLLNREFQVGRYFNIV